MKSTAKAAIIIPRIISALEPVALTIDEFIRVIAARQAAPIPGQTAAAPGYPGNDNDRFTDEERQALASGSVVIRGTGYSRKAYFAAVYGAGVCLVYCAYTDDVRDCLNPSSAPTFEGFLVGSDLYTNTKAIADKMREDISARVRALVPSEEAAEALLKDADDYTRGRIDRLKGQSFDSSARDLFFRDQRPALTLYTETPGDLSDTIQYIKDPARMVELFALDYIASRPETICEAWITYNREQAEYNAIVGDPAREEHERLRISRSVGDQKTVRVLLECGDELRIEAAAIKSVIYNRTIFDFRVLPADRHKLRGENGRNRDIDASEIVAIRHGNQVLYERPAKPER